MSAKLRKIAPIAMILCVAVITRSLKLSDIPAGIHRDEAYAAYNAWSMINYGVDSWEYHNPVYFVAWGSGMNVLNSYLMMPFIKIFGLNVFSIRLPQAILSTISVYFFYKLMNQIFGDKVALLCAFLLTVCPWEIVMGRNNIESSLLPYFIIMATYFFVLGIKRNGWFLCLSAAMYGLALYSYAVVWPILPFLILLQTGYALYFKKIKYNDVRLWLAAIVLLIMALPLLLFMLINYGIMPEIRTEFISIPRLVYMRSGDISLKLMPDNLVHLLNTLDRQQTSADVNSFAEYGLFYKFSNWFILVGACVLISECIKKIKNKIYDERTYLVIWLVCAFVLGTLLPRVNIIRINVLYPMLTMCLALGICIMAKKYWDKFYYAMIIVYMAAFISFGMSYARNYNSYVAEYYQPEIEECIDFAKQLQPRTIYFDDTISFAKILFYEQMPVSEFIRLFIVKSSNGTYVFSIFAQ